LVEGAAAALAPPPAPLPQLAAQRDCPHYGGQVSIVALLTTPEVASEDGPFPLRVGDRDPRQCPGSRTSARSF
jgi:hypothetical protein